MCDSICDCMNVCVNVCMIMSVCKCKYMRVKEYVCKCICMNAAAAAKLLQSCPTLCDPIYGSPPGSPVPGILQARILEWGAIAFSYV